ncbi:MAG: addiction module protein [Alphaproteobacteria bacterium]|nr:addiction module protein [Alphaproteobacteria bacterium]
MTATDIRAAALALPEDERERLAMDLWDSLSRDDGVGDAWAAEIERRVRALENGEVELVSQEDARARIHGRLADLHR